MRETIEYLHYIRTLTMTDAVVNEYGVESYRHSKIVYSPVSTITPKVKVIEQAMHFNIVITDKNMVCAYPAQDGEVFNTYSDDVKYLFELTEEDSLLVVCDGQSVKVGVSELPNTMEPLALFNIPTRISCVIPMPAEPFNATRYGYENRLRSVYVDQ